jgi:CheY-like chemotaxis protein
MLHGIRHTVLLIEADRSLRRLISLGLQNRGMHVIEASSPTNLPILESQQPGLVVLDIDGEAGSNHSLLSTVQAHPYLSTLPMVVLAWDCLLPVGICHDALRTQVTCLTKPFDARALQATIEQMLAATKEIGVETASRQELVPAMRTAAPAPSIWPLITAVGLLLSFIGLMTQITISALGLVIVIVALLWWTLGSKTEREPLVVEIG